MHAETGLCLDGTKLHSEENVLATVCANVPDQLWKFDFYSGGMVLT